MNSQQFPALQVALAQPGQTAAPPLESAPSPVTQGHITQAAADSDSRAAASRQAIGVVQASVLSNRALPALLPSMQAPGPSTASGLQLPENAEAPAIASADAPAPLQQPQSAQQAEAEPSTSSSTTPSDRHQAASNAEAPRGDDAIVPGPELGRVGGASAVQTSRSEPVAVRPSGEGLPGDNTAFFSTTNVLQPDAATPDSGTDLIKISFKSQALTSQLYRAAPGSEELLVLQPLAAAYAPAPVGQVQSSAYGGYSRTVDINVAPLARQAAQATGLTDTYAAPIPNIAGTPGPAVAALQPNKVAAAPKAAGSSLDSLAPATPAHETAR